MTLITYGRSIYAINDVPFLYSSTAQLTRTQCSTSVFIMADGHGWEDFLKNGGAFPGLKDIPDFDMDAMLSNTTNVTAGQSAQPTGLASMSHPTQPLSSAQPTHQELLEFSGQEFDDVFGQGYDNFFSNDHQQPFFQPGSQQVAYDAGFFPQSATLSANPQGDATRAHVGGPQTMEGPTVSLSSKSLPSHQQAVSPSNNSLQSIVPAAIVPAMPIATVSAPSGPPLIKGLTGDVHDFSTYPDGALGYMYAIRRNFDPQGGGSSIDKFVEREDYWIQKLKEAIAHIDALPDPSLWELPEKTNAMMIEKFEIAVANTPDADIRVSAIAEVIFKAFCKGYAQGDHFYESAMPHASTFKLKDNKWSPEKRMDLMLEFLRGCKTLAANLLSGSDAILEFVSAPHSRWKAIYDAAKSNARKVMKAEAKEAALAAALAALAAATPAGHPTASLTVPSDVPASNEASDPDLQEDNDEVESEGGSQVQIAGSESENEQVGAASSAEIKTTRTIDARDAQHVSEQASGGAKQSGASNKRTLSNVEDGEELSQMAGLKRTKR